MADYEPLRREQPSMVGPGEKGLPPADLRVAHALEFIAGQLGQINDKLDRLIAAGAPPAAPPGGR